MRKLLLLKSVVDILFVLAMIGVIFMLPLILMVAAIPEQVPFKFTSEIEMVAGRTQWELIISLVMVYVGYVFLVYGLFLFKKTLVLFQKRIIFDNRVIKNFDQMGKAILIGYFITLVPMIFFSLTENPVEVKLSFGLNESFLIVGLGLFFIVLSEVFQMGKNLKEESELTV
ncbi:DUF2975 domain-containing protein [uncultured Flavobacterium sp.]|uniref:DUF2975 domain-containing protein n=1 Tax=uncultured Flavobacterium sp. TaxID=165435 RepID=UPI0025CE161C|nr:DUF2975 domain-containing protein [uncultured Flavobacterium sp.]